MKSKTFFLLIVGCISFTCLTAPLFASATIKEATDVGISFTEEPAASSEIPASVSETPSSPKKNDKKDFPYTGEKRNQWIAFSGVAVIVLVAFLSWKRKRRI